MSKYTDLIRLRLSAAVAFSAMTGFLISETYNRRLIGLLVWGVFLLAAGASVLNQVSEQHEDGLMTRTKSRPLPQNKIKPHSAILLSVCLITAGLVILFLTGWIPALLGLLNVVLYNFVYTPLKKHSSLAVIPGAAVGAIPPLIGFTAAGTHSLSAGIILFAAFMFLWQIPHFWLIILKYRDDYQRAGFKTIHGNNLKIRNLVFLWVLFSTVLLMIFMSREIILNRTLLMLLVPVNILFILLFHRLLYNQIENSSMQKAFILVNTFGLVVMLAFIVNAIITIS